MHDMSEYWQKLVTKLREGLSDESAAPEPKTERAPEPYTTKMPDLAPSTDLLNIVEMARDATRGIIDLNQDDWEVLIDETTFVIASALRHNGSIVLPNIGKLEIVYGKDRVSGHITLDEAALPKAVL